MSGTTSRCDVRAWGRIAIVACAVLIASRSTGHAQIPSLIDLSAQYTPPGKLDAPQQSQAQISSLDLTINLPIPLAAKSFLILGGGYQVDTVSFPRMPTADIEQQTFRAPAFSAMFVQLMPKRWILLGRVSATLSAGFDGLERRTIGYNAVALAMNSISDDLLVGGGAILTGGFGHMLPLPGAMLNWKPFDHLLIETFIPAFVNVRYSVQNRFEIGARLEVNSSTYVTKESRVANRWPCSPQSSDDPSTPEDETMTRMDSCLDHINYTVGSAGIIAGIRLTSTLWLTAFGGVELYRRFEEDNRAGDALNDGMQALPATMVFRTNITWRIPH
jgi:hypothetical protein